MYTESQGLEQPRPNLYYYYDFHAVEMFLSFPFLIIKSGCNRATGAIRSQINISSDDFAFPV